MLDILTAKDIRVGDILRLNTFSKNRFEVITSVVHESLDCIRIDSKTIRDINNYVPNLYNDCLDSACFCRTEPDDIIEWSIVIRDIFNFDFDLGI